MCCQSNDSVNQKYKELTDEEKQELERDYENLKMLLEFHSKFGVPKDPKEMQQIVDQILDEMLRIQKELSK